MAAQGGAPPWHRGQVSEAVASKAPLKHNAGGHMYLRGVPSLLAHGQLGRLLGIPLGQLPHDKVTRDKLSSCHRSPLYCSTSGVFFAFILTLLMSIRETLAAMKSGWRNGEGITGPACHLPQLINPFKHMLWILKASLLHTCCCCCHSSKASLTWSPRPLISSSHGWKTNQQ